MALRMCLPRPSHYCTIYTCYARHTNAMTIHLRALHRTAPYTHHAHCTHAKQRLFVGSGRVVGRTAPRCLGFGLHCSHRFDASQTLTSLLVPCNLSFPLFQTTQTKKQAPTSARAARPAPGRSAPAPCSATICARAAPLPPRPRPTYLLAVLSAARLLVPLIVPNHFHLYPAMLPMPD